MSFVNIIALRQTIPDSRGRLSLRFVPLLLLCDRYCLSAGREAPPYGLCRVSAVVFYVLPFSDSRGRLSLRFVPRFCCDKNIHLERAIRESPLRFIHHRTHYPALTNYSLFISVATSSFIIHYSLFIIFCSRPTVCAAFSLRYAQHPSPKVRVENAPC